jgi:predicted AAA+ superfamily ATPase
LDSRDRKTKELLHYGRSSITANTRRSLVDLGSSGNGAELARSLGVTEQTVRRYLDILSATYVV